MGLARVGIPLMVFVAVSCVAAWAKEPPVPSVRTVVLTYEASVKVGAEAQKVVLWLPRPRHDAHQLRDREQVAMWVDGARLEGEVGSARVLAEGHNGNSYWVFRAQARLLKVVATWQVTRLERLGSVFRKLSEPERAGWLKPNRLVPTDGIVGERAAALIEGESVSYQRAHSLYRGVLDSMRYDKSQPGYGRGDAAWACGSGFGNCTDFHALFIGMARAAAIPARFVMGVPLPPEAKRCVIGGYHCWGEFHAGDSWYPVDISEADKHPKLADYYFGNLTQHRVAFTVGRDLRLPGQQGEAALNYVIYPYVELDGVAVQDGVAWKMRFRDGMQPTPRKAAEGD